MKKILLVIIFSILLFLATLASILSTVGFETDKFNKFISSKAVENNKRIDLELKKVKFKFDIKQFDLFLETKNPRLTYKELPVPIQNIRVYLDFFSLLKSRTKINKIIVASGEIDINQLKQLVIRTKPSTFNSLIINKVKKGKITSNIELYFNEDLYVNNFIARGKVKEMSGELYKDIFLKKTSFNFFADPSDILIKNIETSINGFSINKGNLQIKKDIVTKVKADFVSQISLNKININNYLEIFDNFKFINKYTELDAELTNYIDITFDKTFKVINYTYKNKGQIKKFNLKFDKPKDYPFLEKEIDVLNIQDSDLEARFSSDNKNYINTRGKFSLKNDNYQNFELKNNLTKKTMDISLNLDFVEKIKIDFINYNKSVGKISNLSFNVILRDDLVNLNSLIYTEGKSSISVKKLKISKSSIISLKEIKVKTYDNNNIKNDFALEFNDIVRIKGNRYDAKYLNKLISGNSQKNIFKEINKNIEIDIKIIETPLSKKLKNFRLIGTIERGKFVKISSKGDFGDNKFLDISMKNDKKNKKQFLEIYSDLPQPLLSEYSFFKGLSDGVLIFSSIIEKNSSTSKLIIEDFKVVNAPGVVKLLSLADFGGLADLAEGDGLSFEKMEINATSNKGLLKLNELYAVGPSISVLMEGYKESTGLTSLRGTLVPAKNLNKFLSKIPVIGKIIIPEEVGEGLFGVSFKMKGMPSKIKTTINPIKTLTPRFITRALEKSKQTK